MLAAGVVCGTSLDGIDVALVDIRPGEASYVLRPASLETVPWEGRLAQGLREALPPAAPGPATVTRLDATVGAAFGDAVRRVAGGRRIDFVASHGVTLYHAGDDHVTLQIGDPFAIRERVGATVVSDFRRADCAAGGQGAPLVPYVDALLFASADRFRAALNLGGIANVTLLEPGATGARAVAWDTGPANMLIDAFVRRRTNGRERYDADGRHAACGSVDETLLRTLLADPYFSRRPPKSTGREEFGDAFLNAYASAFGPLSLEDGCATLVALTAQSVADAIRLGGRDAGDVVVSGGGVHNAAMMEALAARLPGMEVADSRRFGVDPDFKEALAFAVLGYELLRERPAGLPRVTGARHGALLGSIAPAHLRTLQRRIDEELQVASQEQP